MPVLHNVDAQAKTTLEAIKTALVEQLYTPVQWTQTIQTIAADGVTHCVNVDPGKVLAGLNKRIDKTLTCASITQQLTTPAVMQALRKTP